MGVGFVGYFHGHAHGAKSERRCRLCCWFLMRQCSILPESARLPHWEGGERHGSIVMRLAGGLTTVLWRCSSRWHL
jgi:hypothetical protein